MTPSVVDLPDMLSEQKTTFESMAVSNAFDNEGIGQQNSVWTIWYLTPRVFEKEAEEKELQKVRQKALQEAEQKASQEPQEAMRSQKSKQAFAHETESGRGLDQELSAGFLEASKPSTKEIMVACWDPELYRSKILWPVICLFGASFGALHLIS